MPHCTIEYAEPISIPSSVLIEAVRLASASSGLFDENHIKLRAIGFTDYQVGIGNEKFIHVTARILSGRTLEQRKQLSSILLNALGELPLNNRAITVEIVEMERESYGKQLV